ncbi:hypothetical protein TRAPUB_12287 [Trametes pubescens]|uniref:Uncharacterized protein n=1 Tax=Trametes pubescens TaxID=154538 RepID=A0A1M2VUI5_TRAPU|nr:hypothetical protein TRAPUB_12287 [Trametes pubescens]
MVQRGDHCLTSIPEMTPYTPSASPTTFLLSRKALSASSIRPLSDATNNSTSAPDNAAPSPLGFAVAVSADGANANSHNQEQNRDTGSEESPPAYTPAPAHDGIAIAV